MLDVSNSFAAWLNLPLIVWIQAVAESNTKAAQSVPGSRLRAAYQWRHYESGGVEGDRERRFATPDGRGHGGQWALRDRRAPSDYRSGNLHAVVAANPPP